MRSWKAPFPGTMTSVGDIPIRVIYCTHIDTATCSAAPVAQKYIVPNGRRIYGFLCNSSLSHPVLHTPYCKSGILDEASDATFPCYFRLLQTQTVDHLAQAFLPDLRGQGGLSGGANDLLCTTQVSPTFTAKTRIAVSSLSTVRTFGHLMKTRESRVRIAVQVQKSWTNFCSSD